MIQEEYKKQDFIKSYSKLSNLWTKISVPLRAIAVFTVTSFLSCGENIKQGAVNNILLFDTIQVNETYQIRNDLTMPKCSLTVRFIYPADDSENDRLKEIQELFVVNFFDESYSGLNPKEAVHAFKEHYFSEYKSFAEEYIDITEDKDELAMLLTGVGEFTNRIHFNRGDVVSFFTDGYRYTGLNPFVDYVKTACNINLKTGTLIQESDLFNDGYKEKLAPLIVQKIVEWHEVKDIEELKSYGGFRIEYIVPNNNFLIDAEGITYLYEVYEIAPHSSGRSEAFLPYSEISLYLKKNSVVAEWAGLK